MSSLEAVESQLCSWLPRLAVVLANMASLVSGIGLLMIFALKVMPEL